jgi:hypothetical protein
VCGDKVQGRVVARVLAGLEVADFFFVLGEAIGCGVKYGQSKVNEQQGSHNMERCTYADAT